MTPYLLHSSILLSGCFLFYWLFIRNETFFNLNRWVLIGSILLSVSIPLVSVPEAWSLRVIEKSDIIVPEVPANEVPVSIDPDQPMALHTQESVTNESEVLASSEVLAQKQSEVSNSGFTISWPTVLWYGYLIGVGVFFLAFMLQLLILMIKKYTLISFMDGRFRIVELVKDEAPYSFWDAIFINPRKYDLETYTQIIDHEKIHIQQAHFIDKLIAEFLLIVFWFNPFVWLLRNAITNNLEYLTDFVMLEKGVAKKTYQMSLLRVSVPQHPLNLSTNYNNSFLKNRIAMMNAKKSSARSSWKYLFLLPLLGFSIVCLNQVQSKEAIFTIDNEQTPITIHDTISSVISKATTNTSMSFGNTTEGSINKTTTITSNQFSDSDARTIGSTKQISDAENMSVFINGHHIPSNKDGESNRWNTTVKPGHWVAEVDGDHVCFELNNSKPAKQYSWVTHECFKKSELSTIPKDSPKDFHIKRAAGSLNFNGFFTNGSGSGTFTFKADVSFNTYLASQGMSLKKDEDLLHLFLNNVDKDYVSYLLSQSFKADGNDLVQLSVHGINKEKVEGFIQIFKELDYKGYKVQDLIQFEIHDVDPAYVNEIRAQGMTDLTVSDIVQAKIHDVDPDFIKSVRDYGLDVSLQEIIQFSIHDVDVEYIEAMKNLGYKNMSHNDIVQSSIHDVSPEYIKSIHEAGFSDMSMNQLVQFSIHDIDASYIKGFKDAGLTNLSHQDIIQAGIHDVDIDFVKSMAEYGLEDLDMDEIINLAIHDVDAEYLTAMNALGYRDLDNNEITQAKIHGIKPSYIKELKEQGMDDMDIEEVIQFSIHGIKVSDIKAFRDAGFEFGTQEIIQAGIHNVSAKYIKDMRALGFEDAELEDFIQAKIHNVSPSFVKRARDKGHNVKTLEEYVRLKIHGI